MSSPSDTSSHGLWDLKYFDKDRRAYAAEALSKISSMYESGTPLFTKECIEDVHRQLQKVGEKDKISVTGVDGVAVDFDIQTGSIMKAADPDLEYILEAPVIHYLAGPWLMNPMNASMEPHLIYCNLRIMHSGITRNKLTKEAVSSESIRSTEDVEKLLRDCLETWKMSDSWKQLESDLLAAKITSSGITKIVGFACGPISTADYQDLTERSLYQHALLLTVHHLLSERSENSDGIPCYVQDPAYTDIDKMVLAQSGLTVLDDPEAFLEVDESAVVFSFSPDVPVRQIVSDLTRPAIMIWNNVMKERFIHIEKRFSLTISADPVSPRLREMVLTMYDELEFPGDKEHFGNLAVYVRPPDTVSAE